MELRKSILAFNPSSLDRNSLLTSYAFHPQILAVISPYFVGEQYGNLGPKVFFIWGGLCTCATVYAYFLVPETKGLTLEQVDRMLEETTPRTSSSWRPKTTFAAEMGMSADGKLNDTIVEDVERKGSAY